jgi:protein-disulfide isomerase
MPPFDPQVLVGTDVWPGLHVDALVTCDAALATYAATSLPDAMQCTLRVALAVPLPPERDEAVAAALQRLVRHSFGIASLCPPRAAGAVVVGAERVLGLSHAGSPYDTAQARLDAGAPVPIQELLALLEPVVAALSGLHDQGLVHGALHPAAVRLATGGPVLSAFGLSELAVLLGGAIAARDAVPPRSRVPEQVGIVPAAPSQDSDTYALAMLACELLLGRPFTAETEPSSIARVIDQPMLRPTPGALGLELAEHQEKAFAAALQTQPRERLLSPRSFLTALATPEAPPPRVEPMPAVRAPEPPASTGPLHPAADRMHQKQPRPGRSAFTAPPLGAPPPPRADSSTFLVYSLVFLGILLLIGGAATVFVLAQRRVPALTPIASAPLFGTASPPPVAPTPPTPPVPSQPEPEPTASADPGPPLSAAPSAAPPPAPHLASAAAWYPDDLTALVPLGKDTPVLGNRDAFVTLVVFADMQCPHTRQARGVLESLRRRYDADLRIAVRHLPVPSHDKAEDAAEVAAITGALAGPMAFWHLFEMLTNNQGALETQDMVQWAQQAGAPAAAVRKALQDHTYQRIVEADRAVAQRLMVRATPAMFINGIRLDGARPQAMLVEVIDKELAAARAAHRSGTARSRLYSSRVTFNVTSAEADPPRPPSGPRRRP